MHQEKKNYGYFFIFVHKNINRNGFQKILIGPLQDFEKIDMKSYTHIQGVFLLARPKND